MGINFEPQKCVGCKYCELACSASHEGVFNPAKARLNIVCRYVKDDVRVKGNTCILCKACIRVCPTKAIAYHDGHLIFNEDLCTNCGVCASKCPQNCIVLTEEKPLICDLCGGEPTCVAWCPHGALTYKKEEK